MGDPSVHIEPVPPASGEFRAVDAPRLRTMCSPCLARSSADEPPAQAPEQVLVREVLVLVSVAQGRPHDFLGLINEVRLLRNARTSHKARVGGRTLRERSIA